MSLLTCIGAGFAVLTGLIVSCLLLVALGKLTVWMDNHFTEYHAMATMFIGISTLIGIMVWIIEQLPKD